ncbi:alpha/beta hydrolase [Mycobacterium sp. 050128]|uniref:alpha/beta fold hydrolase n=1 Tax=Mycobacterium sp. 050128 TaxID=3096112 RepID=UPI002ED98C4B
MSTAQCATRNTNATGSQPIRRADEQLMSSPTLAKPDSSQRHRATLVVWPSVRPHPATTPAPASAPTLRMVLTSDGVQLAVNDFGSQHPRHTIVFLHGLCLNSSTWDVHIQTLRHQYGPSLRLISYDHRGHGRSASAPLSSYTIDQLSDDLAQVLRALSVTGSLTVVAHSMGGMTALAYLRRPKSQRPVEPTGLVLVATAAGKLTERGLGRLLATPGIGKLLALGTHAPEHLLCGILKPVCLTAAHLGSRLPAATLAAMTLTALSMSAPSTALGFLPTLRTYDVYPTLRAIEAQTTIICGAADPLTPPAHSRDIAAAIPGARCVNVPGAGHMLPQQASAIIGRAITDALPPWPPQEVAPNARSSPPAAIPLKTAGSPS